MTLRVACLQMRHDGSLEQNLERVREIVGEAAERADLALLPEYFFGPSEEPDAHEAVRELLSEVTDELDLALAGNVVEPEGDGLVNVGVVYEDGEPVLEQPKLQPMDHEQARGIRPGEGLPVATVAGCGVGMVVCADVLFPEIAQALSDRGARVLLNPVMSPYRPEDPTRKARESMYVARAYDTASFVVKAGGLRGDDAVGRSLVAAPWGLLARYTDERAEEVLVAELDRGRLADVREAKERFPKRRASVRWAWER